MMKSFGSALALSALLLTSSPATAASRLSPQDVADIQQLYARYNFAIDTGDAAGWADTFTADGVFNKVFTGREALMGFIKLWREKLNGANRRHWNSNLNLSATPSGAHGGVYLMLLDVGVKPAAIASTGTYSDELVKTKDGWRFKTRAVISDPAPKP
jgi:SnoaL-like domain